MLAALAVAAAHPTAQGPDPEVRAHVDALIEAINSGDPAKFEAMAEQHFAPEMLKRRTPEDRRQVLARLKSDPGTISADRIRRDNETLTLELHTSTGMNARLRLGIEAHTPHRFTSLGIEVGDRDDEPGQAAAPPVNGRMSDAELSSALGPYLAALAAADQLSGVVLVAKNGVTVFEKAYGPADRANQVANTPATRFNIGSINKAFTKAAIAQLVTSGKIKVTDTIGQLLPDYPNADAKAATVDQLLNHTAGIADFFGAKFSASSKAEFRSNADYFRFVAAEPLTFPPGSRREYCNGCFIVLGAVIERVSGMAYEAYIQQRVFTPAGMGGAAFLRVDEPTANVAIGYTRRQDDGARTLRSNVYMHGAAGSGAGGAYATAADLLAFDRALRDGRVLDQKAAAWYFGAEGGGASPAQASYGIAGGAPGVSAVLEASPIWTVVVVSNLDPPFAEQLGARISRALTAAKDEERETKDDRRGALRAP
jgi:D-alanyl-D-alanine carboxypeptidase